MKKKLIGMLLVLVMITAMLPLEAVFAAADENVLTSLIVSVTPPAAGRRSTESAPRVSIGEVAGVAAALAVKHGVGLREVESGELQAAL